MTKIPSPKSGGGLGILAPDGLQRAICVDEEDLGMVFSEYYGNSSHKIALHFLLAETIPATWTHPHTNEVIDVKASHPDLVGRQFGLSKRYTASLNEKSNLRHDLKTWRGRDFTLEELDDFDTENLVGAPCVLNIVHTFSDKHQRWFANIEGISKLPPDWEAPTIPADYKRRKDRDDYTQPDGNGKPQNTTEAPANMGGGEQHGFGPNTSGDPIPESVAAGLSEPDDDLPF